MGARVAHPVAVPRRQSPPRRPSLPRPRSRRARPCACQGLRRIAAAARPGGPAAAALVSNRVLHRIRRRSVRLHALDDVNEARLLHRLFILRRRARQQCVWRRVIRHE